MREPTSRGPRKPAPADDDDDDNLSDEEPPVEEEPFEIPAVCAGACTLQSRVLSRKLSRTRELMTFQQAYKYEEIEARCIICYGFDLTYCSSLAHYLRTRTWQTKATSPHFPMQMQPCRTRTRPKPRHSFPRLDHLQVGGASTSTCTINEQY